MHVLLGESRDLMGVQINTQTYSGVTVMLEQMFIFGVATFIADLTRHLGHVKTFPACRI